MGMAPPHWIERDTGDRRGNGGPMTAGPEDPDSNGRGKEIRSRHIPTASPYVGGPQVRPSSGPAEVHRTPPCPDPRLAVLGPGPAPRGRPTNSELDCDAAEDAAVQLSVGADQVRRRATAQLHVDLQR